MLKYLLVLILMIASVPALSSNCFEGTKWMSDKGDAIEFTKTIVIDSKGNFFKYTEETCKIAYIIKEVAGGFLSSGGTLRYIYRVQGDELNVTGTYNGETKTAIYKRIN